MRYGYEVMDALRKQPPVVLMQPKRELEVWYSFYMNRRSDTDNRVKILQDALEGVLWEDDRWIGVFHASRYPCKAGTERVEVEVRYRAPLLPSKTKTPRKPAAAKAKRKGIALMAAPSEKLSTPSPGRSGSPPRR